jgi:hypothetical protein
MAKLDNPLQKQLEEEYIKLIDTGTYTEKDYNKFLIRKEAVERHYLDSHSEFNYLYPSLNDPKFNIKIAQKQEFFDTQYEGNIDAVEKESNKMCDMDVELAPYQLFVRNFLSFQTPYNSLLLYHGLGSGKTCSAITVAEEMRDYLKQMGINKRIMVVASPNVQDNFKLQLFDERRLEEIDGLWNIKSCTGNKFIREINPMSMKGLSREKVIAQINRIITNSYLFVGYIEFANIIIKKSNVLGDVPEQKRQRISESRLQKFFNDRLIIIDEVHNIRMTDDNKDKRVAINLLKLIKIAKNLRLLLLSATPMYNSYKEIIWLLNIMNINDRRAIIELKDVFDSDGNFVIDSDGEEVGRNILIRKATGYISFVRGENPYTFPYRIFPNEFAPDHTLTSREYPGFQINNAEIIQGLQHINVYLNTIGGYQLSGYQYILDNTVANPQVDNAIGLENMEKFGYTIIQPPLEALNIVYPQNDISQETMATSDDVNKDTLIGKSGLNSIMTYTTTTNPPSRFNFEYRPWVMEQFGRIFSPDNLGNYSAKIKNIGDIVMHSTGIILIYSQYIDGGLVPVALALEELGFTRHDKKSLFASPPREQIDSLTLEPKSTYTGPAFRPATYTMITGDKTLSPENDTVVKNLTASDNSNGEKIKVILISKAGSEGIDFKNIRQIHILDPWYNMNRIEQIVGRGVRTKSHCQLPFKERNVEIYLHATLLGNDQEAIDLYLYRLSELKAIQIGHVARTLKESAVDCLLNISQNNFTVDNMDQIVDQTLSTGQTIQYAVGDKPYSSTCDYMERCSYSCIPDVTITDQDTQFDTYSKSFIMMNTEKIIQRIRQLFKNHYFYAKEALIREINMIRKYPTVQIYAALDRLVNDNNEFIMDRYNRQGHLINIGQYYYFQPLEIIDKRISVFERSTPLEYKRDTVEITLPSEVSETMVKKVENVNAPAEKVVIVTHAIAKKLISAMQENYDLAMNTQIIMRGDDNWYKYCSLTIGRLKSTGITEDLLSGFLVAHIIEMLLFTDKLILLEYVFSNDDLTDFERKIKTYFEKYIMQGRNLTAILLENNGMQQMLVKKGRDWAEAQPQDYKDLQSEIIKYIVPHDDMAKIMGFIIGFKDQYMIFKVKDMTLKRHKGARCDQAGKADTIKLLNKTMGKDTYTNQNTREMVQMELCSLHEILLRYFDSIKKDGKRWFLTPEESIINNIQTIKI